MPIEQTEALAKLKFTYVAIHEGQQTAILGEKDLLDWCSQVQDGQATVLRILAYSDLAKTMSNGKECRIEEMECEEYEEGEKEEKKWEISWNLVK